MMEITR